MSVKAAAGVEFPLSVPVAVIGAGACGLIAALAARGALTERASGSSRAMMSRRDF